MKFDDGKESEPGNAPQVQGALAGAATLARLPRCASVFMSGSLRFWWGTSGG